MASSAPLSMPFLKFNTEVKMMPMITKGMIEGR